MQAPFPERYYDWESRYQMAHAPASGPEIDNTSDPATAAASGQIPDGMAATEDALSVGSGPTPGGCGVQRMLRSPGSVPPTSPSLSFVLEEMQREQERHKRRVIIGSALMLGSIAVVLLVVIARLMLFADSVNNARPSTLEYRGGTGSYESQHANASRFAYVG